MLIEILGYLSSLLKGTAFWSCLLLKLLSEVSGVKGLLFLSSARTYLLSARTYLLRATFYLLRATFYLLGPWFYSILMHLILLLCCVLPFYYTPLLFMLLAKLSQRLIGVIWPEFLL